MPPSLLEGPSCDEMGNLQSSFRIGKNALLQGAAASATDADDARDGRSAGTVEGGGDGSIAKPKADEKRRRGSSDPDRESTPPPPRPESPPPPEAPPDGGGGSPSPSSDPLDATASRAGGGALAASPPPTSAPASSANTPEMSSERAGRRSARNADSAATEPAASCASSLSSVRVGGPSGRRRPVKFRCAGCRGDVREPPLDVGGAVRGGEDAEGGEGRKQPVIRCLSPKCQAPRYHLRCSGVPPKSQIYYNAVESSSDPPPSSSAASANRAWWNIPVRRDLLSSDDAVPPRLSSSDAFFGSFQLFDRDPMSSVSSFACPACSVEGSSRYLLEYFELFHAMKKTFYSRRVGEEAEARSERMSECVEARTGGDFLRYLVEAHGADGERRSDVGEGSAGVGARAGSEIRVEHMANVLRFVSRQIPPGETGRRTDGKIDDRKENGEGTAKRHCAEQDALHMASPAKKAKIETGTGAAERSVEDPNCISASMGEVTSESDDGGDKACAEQDALHMASPAKKAKIETGTGAAERSVEDPNCISASMGEVTSESEDASSSNKDAGQIVDATTCRATTTQVTGEQINLRSYENREEAVGAIETYCQSRETETTGETQPNENSLGDEACIRSAKPHPDTSSVNTDAAREGEIETSKRSCAEQNTSEVDSPAKKVKAGIGSDLGIESLEGANDKSASVGKMLSEDAKGDKVETSSCIKPVSKPAMVTDGAPYPGCLTRRFSGNKTWRAWTPKVNGKQTSLGSYETREEALRAIAAYQQYQRTTTSGSDQSNSEGEGDQACIGGIKPHPDACANIDAGLRNQERNQPSTNEQNHPGMRTCIDKMKPRTNTPSSHDSDALQQVDEKLDSTLLEGKQNELETSSDLDVTSKGEPTIRGKDSDIFAQYPGTITQRLNSKKGWRARGPKVNGKRQSLGDFKTREEAFRATMAYHQSNNNLEPTDLVSSLQGTKPRGQGKGSAVGSVYRQSGRNKGWGASGPKVNGKSKWLGRYETREEAVHALAEYHQSQQTKNQDQNQPKANTYIVSQQSHHSKQSYSYTGSLQPCPDTANSHNSHALQQINTKLDPTYLVGMPLQIFNPVDNSYHSGRIIDCKNTLFKVDESTIHSKMITGRLIDNDISSTLYLVRFPGGVDGRRVDVQQWIYLEEHAVTVGSEVCWAKIASGPDPPISYDPSSGSPYRPVQIVFRSMLENISSLHEAEVCEQKNPEGVVGNGVPLTNVLAMGFGEAFSYITLTLQESHTDCESSQNEPPPSAEGRFPLDESSESNEDIANAAITRNTDTHPIVFPFKPRDPTWLNDLLRRVRISDEDVGVAVIRASAEKEEEKRIRSSFRNGTHPV